MTTVWHSALRALLGRDVLNLCLLRYDGLDRAFALTFPPFEEL
jgi:hypothetical protein